ncbi:sulfotransferase family 2 domain-containing protein [Gloeocapsopsis dulcis]
MNNMASSLVITPSFDKAFRILDAITAISSNVFDGSLDAKICFVHLHKCGGTSITQAIKSCYQSLSSITDNNTFHLNGAAASKAAHKSFENHLDSEDEDYLIGKFREHLLLYHMYQSKIKYAAGHFSFSEIAYQNFSGKYAFVTVLRDPVKRWISAYLYSRYGQYATPNLDEDFSDFLNSERAFKGGCLYVKSIGGLDKTGNYTSEAAIERAKENLHKFSVVGFLEHQEIFVKQFEQQFGRKLRIRKYNRTNKSKTFKKSLISEEIEAKIREICRPDIEVYQYAMNNFLQNKYLVN